MSITIHTLPRLPAVKHHLARLHGLGRLIVLGIALLALASATGTPAQAGEPLRLHLVRSAADTEAHGAQCIRGRLYAVRAFDEEATTRGVWLADTLEFVAALEPGETVPAGIQVGVADGDDAAGLRIEIASVETVLRAHPEGRADHAPGTILLGRRQAAASNAPCDPQRERLEDGAALVRRLRDIYGGRGNGQPIEILMSGE